MDDKQINELVEKIYNKLVTNGNGINWIGYNLLKQSITDYLQSIGLYKKG